MLSRRHSRLALHASALAVLLAATLHCPWEWSRDLHHLSAAARHREAGLPLPVGFPTPGCENESGCICRGATVAHAVDASWLANDMQWTWLAAEASAVPGEWVSLDSKILLLLDEDAPPISGRQLRALYASLVI